MLYFIRVDFTIYFIKIEKEKPAFFGKFGINVFMRLTSFYYKKI